MKLVVRHTVTPRGVLYATAAAALLVVFLRMFHTGLLPWADWLHG